jgi:hypothetical protein
MANRKIIMSQRKRNAYEIIGMSVNIKCRKIISTNVKVSNKILAFNMHHPHSHLCSLLVNVHRVWASRARKELISTISTTLVSLQFCLSICIIIKKMLSQVCLVTCWCYIYLFFFCYVDYYKQRYMRKQKGSKDNFICTMSIKRS